MGVGEGRVDGIALGLGVGLEVGLRLGEGEATSRAVPNVARPLRLATS